MTVDGEIKTRIKIGDSVNFTILNDNVYIDSCTAFNLDDKNDTDLGCISGFL